MITVHLFEGKVIAHHGTKQMELNCTAEQYKAGKLAYETGSMMQVAFAFLSPGEREFLISGTTPAEWAAMFGDEEDA